jgi:hypothetical protein
MSRVWIFVDEQGDVKFGQRNSNYFGLAAVTTRDPSALTAEMDQLRHNMWSGGHLPDGYFHAQSCCFEVNRAVYESFTRVPIVRCDVVALRKEGVFPQLRSPRDMYRISLEILLKIVFGGLPQNDDVTIVTARWSAIPDLRPLVSEVGREQRADAIPGWDSGITALQCPASTHAGLQYADYLAFASHRNRTRGDGAALALTRKPGRGRSDFTAFKA